MNAQASPSSQKPLAKWRHRSVWGLARILATAGVGARACACADAGAGKLVEPANLASLLASAALLAPLLEIAQLTSPAASALSKESRSCEKLHRSA
jgi:hypothetical protein